MSSENERLSFIDDRSLTEQVHAHELTLVVETPCPSRKADFGKEMV